MDLLLLSFFCGINSLEYKNLDSPKVTRFRNFTEDRLFFNSSISQEAEQILKELSLSYSKVFGSKRNLLTQVIKDEKNDWFDILRNIANFVGKKSPDFALRLNILYSVANFIFTKLENVYRTEIVDSIINPKDKNLGISELNLTKIDISKLDLQIIENKLRHGQKIYLSMLGDLKEMVINYKDKDKKEVKEVLLTLISLIEASFGKIKQSVSNIKNFINYKETLTSFNPNTVRIAYNLIGYKVGGSGLTQNSTPYEILNLKDWEKNNLEHIRFKHKNLLESFGYLKNNMDVQDKLYEIIVGILNEALETIESN